jgi:alanine racemase
LIEKERAWAEININNFENNIIQIKKHIDKNIKILAVLKADAYGHGAASVIKFLKNDILDYIGVAIYEEGKELRNSGVNIPILVLGYTPTHSFKNILKYNLVQTIYNFDMAKELSEVALKLNKTAYIHIKIDTGMARLGFNTTDESIKIINEIAKLPNININGIYTHFSKSDIIEKKYTNEQYDNFSHFLSKLNIKSVIHAANSGAILGAKNTHADMVRCGILMYGVSPSNDIVPNINLLPVMSLKARVASIKTIKKNSYIGYGFSYITTKDTIVATISVGYADGYFRLLSNKGRVLINGEYAPVIGNICMDQFMVDVTHIKGIKQDDIVILIGKHGNKEIKVEELAYSIGTIGYEILCNVSKRVPRVYIKDNKIIDIVKYSGF